MAKAEYDPCSLLNSSAWWRDHWWSRRWPKSDWRSWFQPGSVRQIEGNRAYRPHIGRYKDFVLRLSFRPFSFIFVFEMNFHFWTMLNLVHEKKKTKLKKKIDLRNKIVPRTVRQFFDSVFWFRSLRFRSRKCNELNEMVYVAARHSLCLKWPPSVRVPHTPSDFPHPSNELP